MRPGNGLPDLVGGGPARMIPGGYGALQRQIVVHVGFDSIVELLQFRQFQVFQFTILPCGKFHDVAHDIVGIPETPPLS